MCEDESPECEESLIGGRNFPMRTAVPTRTVILSPLPPSAKLSMGMVGNVGFDKVGMVGIEENLGFGNEDKVSAMKAKVAMLALATLAMKAK
ncbi:hypothetical protein CFP56_035831, partial [Quercus suber]